jgi:hypothetical protein
MSQNKTVVPGMEAENTPGREHENDFYTKNVNLKSTVKGTIVPGMNDDVCHQSAAPQSGAYASQGPHHQGKPVVGFLYSVSRQGIGEYWPLHLGQNVIGSSVECDVRLRERTVTAEHAVLITRKMKSPEDTEENGNIIAAIKDECSTNGTLLNGRSLAFSANECFNGDIITIGKNYELLLILIDVKALGLKVSENFIVLDSGGQEQPANNRIGDNYPRSTRPVDLNPPKFQSPDRYYGNRVNDGTQGLDGDSGSAKQGGTVGM